MYVPGQYNEQDFKFFFFFDREFRAIQSSLPNMSSATIM